MVSGRVFLSALTAGAIAFSAMAFSTVAFVPGAVAQEIENVQTFNDWTSYIWSPNGEKRCLMASKPLSESGDYTRRGDVSAWVMHRPGSDRFGEIGFEMGYPIKEKSTVTAKIGNESFEFFTSGSNAFAYPEDEAKLLKAMRAGARLVVTGTSTRGTLTTDTYSLSGVTKANQTIDKDCGR